MFSLMKYLMLAYFIYFWVLSWVIPAILLLSCYFFEGSEALALTTRWATTICLLTVLYRIRKQPAVHPDFNYAGYVLHQYKLFLTVAVIGIIVIFNPLFLFSRIEESFSEFCLSSAIFLTIFGIWSLMATGKDKR